MRRGFKLGLNPPIGTRDMLSMPPATTTSPRPSIMLCAAIFTACKLEAQKRLTVVPPTVSGRPASATTRRARFIPCSPSGKAQPRITSSISARSSCGTRSTAALTASAARSSARTSLSAPLLARPIGVRTALTMTASDMSLFSFFLWRRSLYDALWREDDTLRMPGQHLFTMLIMTDNGYRHIDTSLAGLHVCDCGLTTDSIPYKYWPYKFKDHHTRNIIHIATKFGWQRSGQQAVHHEATLLI